MPAPHAAKRKKAAVRKPLATAEAPVNYLLDGRTLPYSIERGKALTLSADDPKAWVVETGMTPSSLAKKARTALIMDYLRHNSCSDCGRKRPELAPEERFLIYPGMPLCICLMPKRKLDHTYRPDWNSPEGRTLLIEAVVEGKLSVDEPIYQWAECHRCKEGPVVVRAGLVVRHLLRYRRHNTRSLCDRCDLKTIANEVARVQRSSASAAQPASKHPTAPIIDFPKNGPAGKFKKHKKNKDSSAPQQGVAIPEASLPPLTAFTGTPEVPPAQ